MRGRTGRVETARDDQADAVSDDAAAHRPGPAQTAALTLGQSAPDPELLAVGQRVLETVLTHHTSPADLLGLPCGCTTLREEEVGVDPHAVGSRLPVAVLAAVQQ